MKILKIILSMLLVLTTVACNSHSTNNNKQIHNEVLNREENSIAIPENIEKVISLAPAITETLINLGLSDKLIGVDEYSLELDSINKDLTVFDMMSPDIESIINLQPDIILSSGLTTLDGTTPFTPIMEMGIAVIVIPTPESIDGIIEDILFIGKVTRTEDRANEIVNSLVSEIEEIEYKIENANISDVKKVYFETSPLPYIYTFGKNVFLNELLELLKVENIFLDQKGWIGISEEQVIEKNPDIIFVNNGYSKTPVEDIKSRIGWENISAIKNDKVYLIDDNSSSRANENIIKALREMAISIYPDVFS